MTAPATQHLKALYGLKFNPFGQDVPRDALLCSPRVDDFGWRLEHGVAAEGGFALVTGGVGSGKTSTASSASCLVSRSNPTIAGPAFARCATSGWRISRAR